MAQLRMTPALYETPTTVVINWRLSMDKKRDKACAQCAAKPEALFRCRYGEARDWRFLCEACLLQVRAAHEVSYQYGGTWKRHKR